MDCAWLDTALDTSGKRYRLLMPIKFHFSMEGNLNVNVLGWACCISPEYADRIQRREYGLRVA